MWVVKLGGSLMESPYLPKWLEVLGRTGSVIVPGGGPFAQAVRTAQARWRFDEATAHHMAILGMRQYGKMLAALGTKLPTGTTEEQLAALPGSARIWLPLPELLDQANIPATWGVTSDSLAVWLAGRVRAENLLLVKSVDLTEFGAMPTISLAQVVSRGWIDPLFPAYATKSACQCWLCDAGAVRYLPQALNESARYFIGLRK